nr:vpu protein [Human immunodeficiency virus 1]
MHQRDVLVLVVFIALSIVSLLIWLFSLKYYLEKRNQERREEEILKRLRRIIEIKDDSDYGTTEEEEQEVMDLMHNHGFDNPMFEL